MRTVWEELFGNDGLIDFRDLIKLVSVRRILYREGAFHSCFTNIRILGIRVARIQSSIDP